MLAGISIQLKGLDCLFQREFVCHQLVEVHDLTAETLDRSRPRVPIPVDELKVDLKGVSVNSMFVEVIK